MKSIFRIMRATSSLWPYYVIILACSVLTAVASLATPFVLKFATDAVVAALNGDGGSTVRIIFTFAGLYLVVQLLMTVVSNYGGYQGDIMGQKMRSLLSTRYFHKLLSLPQSYFDGQLTGTVVSRLNRSIAEVTFFIKSMSNNFFSMFVSTVAVLVVMFIYYWPLAVLLLIIYPTYLWLTGLTSKKWQGWEKDKNEHVDLAGGRFNEVISQLRVVKSFGTQARELAGFAEHFTSTVSLTRSQSRHWHTMDVYRRSILNIVFFAMYLLIFWKTLTGEFSLGDMVLMIQLMAMASQPVSMLSWIIDSAQRAIAGSREYFEVMGLPDDPRAASVIPSTVTSTIQKVQSSEEGPRKPSNHELPDPVIEFHDVDFAYDGEDPVLRDINLSVRRGEKIAFVGESGGGKSTLMSLLQGLYTPSNGSVQVAGFDTSTSTLGQLRSTMGMVFQDASLFSGTITENIAYAKPDATRDEIVDAARQANADVFIRRFTDGYDSLIGERGLKLSGGQKQRIAVARAILKDAPILILDEATSALDTKSERIVQDALDRLMEGRTSLIIAHRLSTISAVDRIVTLENGRIIEMGTPGELAQSGGIYSELLRLQMSASSADRKRLREFGIVG
ncbi:ABC transporter ATP-binding protein [uncultured Kocuria sp.]|uniref:ABC transporter ATP-binding protein n=1 Tax=uncultured Kocuria sp. TaxID=259305 RepID=UPI0025964364|nr:ABC transporter ATP-binding protein [uncultured Kocuria sp.]MCT1367851.1 ABC transporter ATP-binding protein/permease [Rothia sp. p3-SID1597]